MDLVTNSIMMCPTFFLQLTGNILDANETLKVTVDTIATQLSAVVQGNVHNLSRYSNYEKEIL